MKLFYHSLGFVQIIAWMQNLDVNILLAMFPIPTIHDQNKNPCSSQTDGILEWENQRYLWNFNSSI